MYHPIIFAGKVLSGVPAGFTEVLEADDISWKQIKQPVSGWMGRDMCLMGAADREGFDDALCALWQAVASSS